MKSIKVLQTYDDAEQAILDAALSEVMQKAMT
jgi:hypothetical protein